MATAGRAKTTPFSAVSGTVAPPARAKSSCGNEFRLPVTKPAKLTVPPYWALSRIFVAAGCLDPNCDALAPPPAPGGRENVARVVYSSDGAAAGAAPSLRDRRWEEAVDDLGRVYLYDKDTGEALWPDELEALLRDEEARAREGHGFYDGDVERDIQDLWGGGGDQAKR